jgi:hypothetical protein
MIGATARAPSGSLADVPHRRFRLSSYCTWGGNGRVAMTDSYVKAFIDGLPRMDDEALLKTLVRFDSAPSQYRPESIAAARAEVERRGLANARLDDARNQARQEALDGLVDEAERLAEDGRTIPQIEAHLKARGVDEAAAAGIAERAWNMPADRRKRAGRRNLISGGLLCLLGLLVTAGSCVAAASSPGGGRYVVAWGVVLVGLLQGLRGIAQLNPKH